MFSKVWKSKSEDGSLTIFALMTFLTAISLIGMAIDIARTEMERTRMQLITDNAVLMAASLNQQPDPETGQPLTPTQIVDRYLAQANLPADFEFVTDTDATGTIAEGVNGSRIVKVKGDTTLRTLYMDTLGVDSLDVLGISDAFESPDQPVEVSLVLDMSASMNGSNKMDAMIDAAKEFVSSVLAVNDGANEDWASISLIIYGGYVNAGRDLAAVIQGEYMYPENDLSWELYPGLKEGRVATAPERYHDASLGVYIPVTGLCGIFTDAAYDSTAIWDHDDFTYALPVSHSTNNTPVKKTQNPMAITGYDLNWPYCSSHISSEILPFSSNKRALYDRLDAARLSWATSIDDGMLWGATLLDPSVNYAIKALTNDDFASVSGFPESRKNYIEVAKLDGNGNPIIDGDGNVVTEEILEVSTTQAIDPEFANRPLPYGNALKVLVMMSDGANASVYQPKVSDFPGKSGGWNKDGTSAIANFTGDIDDYYWYNPITQQLFRSWEDDPRFMAMNYDWLYDADGNRTDVDEDYLEDLEDAGLLTDSMYDDDRFGDVEDIYTYASDPWTGVIGTGTRGEIDTSAGYFFQPTWDDLYAVRFGKELASLFGEDKEVKEYMPRPQSGGSKNANLQKVCEDALSKGVLVFTVSYEAKEKHAAVLAKCADPINSQLNSYTADASSIASVFAGISNSLRKLQLTQ